MENEIRNQKPEDPLAIQSVKKDHTLSVSIFISALILSGTWIYTAGLEATNQRTPNISENSEKAKGSELEEKVLPSEGVLLPVVWGDLGAKLVSAGAIDADRFKTIYEKQGTFTDEYKNLLLGQNESKLNITQNNAGYVLNLFWALGLASKNPILDSGEMKDARYSGAQNFASTAGWTMAEGNPIDHYSHHQFFALTQEQQALVDKVSQGIYRPCCGNSTHFPDCNHGMAMLGLLELMASQGVSEQDMWKAAIAVNSYWFPDTYLTIATYMKNKGIDWKDADPQEMLGVNYSSAQGYARIAAKVTEPREQRGGNGCGVDTGETVAPQRQQSGCGI